MTAMVGDMTTLPITCGHCGRAVGAEIVYDSVMWGNVRGSTYVPQPGAGLWLLCPYCGEGSVRARNSGIIYPAPRPGLTLEHPPADVMRAWEEARSAYSVGAYAAAEMMCRKILMHVAVDKGLAEAGQPFVSYMNALRAAGYITTGLEEVADQVRDRGNVANHNLPASSEQESHVTLMITQHLMQAVYELPGIAAAPAQPPAADPTASPGSSQPGVT
jgi:Domain of unknown function (DUF4145)